jgi:hypothetical protein
LSWRTSTALGGALTVAAGFGRCNGVLNGCLTARADQDDLLVAKAGNKFEATAKRFDVTTKGSDLDVTKIGSPFET